MDYTEGFFFETYIPCSGERLGEIEALLGLQLPEGYRELLRQTGGGVLSAAKSLIEIPEVWPGYSECVEKILGNTGDDGDTSSIVGSPELMGPDDWGAPEGLLIFAFSDSGPHASFGINYGVEQFPHLSIVYVDLESDIMVKAADSFGEFMSMLVDYYALDGDDTE